MGLPPADQEGGLPDEPSPVLLASAATEDSQSEPPNDAEPMDRRAKTAETVRGSSGSENVTAGSMMRLGPNLPLCGAGDDNAPSGAVVIEIGSLPDQVQGGADVCKVYLRSRHEEPNRVCQKPLDGGNEYLCQPSGGRGVAFERANVTSAVCAADRVDAGGRDVAFVRENGTSAVCVADRVEAGAIPLEHAFKRSVVAEFRRRLRQAGSLETLRREDPQFVDGVKGHLRDLAVDRQSRQ